MKEGFRKRKIVSLKFSDILQNSKEDPKMGDQNSPVLYSVICQKNPMSLTKNQQKRSFFSHNKMKSKGVVEDNKEILKKVEKIKKIKYELRVPLDLYENKNERKYKSKLKKLKNVSLLLKKIFRNESIELEKMDIEIYEIKILISILERKFNKKFLIIYPCNIVEFKKILAKILNTIKSEISKKRVEENNKFIFKFILRRLKLRFFNENNLKNNKETNDLFYAYFFSENAKKKKMALIEFYDPLNLKPIKKSLNNKYFQLIFQSEKFKDQFLMYNDELLTESYLKLLEKKFHKFLKKYEKVFQEKRNNFAAEEIVKTIKGSKRIKFPWTKNEIETAISFFRKNIHKQLNKL